MLNFNFKNQTEILFGKGQIKEAKSRLAQDSRVLLLYGGGSIKRNGVYDDVIKLLDGVHFTEFSGVEPNPTLETLMQAVELVRSEQLNFILAVGGGSVIDGAKFIAAAAHFDGEPWDILAKGAAFASALPIGAVLTLPATGSESNGNSVVTKKASSQKVSVRARETEINGLSWLYLKQTWGAVYRAPNCSLNIPTRVVHLLCSVLHIALHGPSKHHHQNCASNQACKARNLGYRNVFLASSSLVGLHTPN